MTGKLLIEWLNDRQEKISHRQILLISGDAHWCEQQLSTLIGQLNTSSLLLSDSAIFNEEPNKFEISKTLTNQATETSAKQTRELRQCKISQYKQHLGTEYGLVIYNAFDGLKPNALYAIEGTIGMSGLLVMICPKLESWAEYEAKAQGIAFSYQSQHKKSLFISRMINCFMQDESVALLTSQSSHLPFAFLQSTVKHDLVNEGLNEDQQAAFNGLLTAAQSKHSVGLIRAKRGRGKSTLLGRLAFDLASSNSERPVYISAPHFNNAQRAIQEYRALVKNIETESKSKNTSQDSDINELKYIAPDQIFNLPQNSILLLDEAAAIAPSILLYACQNFKSTVMATTVAGYEGSGLGFNLRVLPKLEKLGLPLFPYELSIPMRWHEDDKLEHLFAKIFAPYPHDSASHSASHSAQRDGSELIQKNRKSPAQQSSHFIHVDKIWLVQHEAILTQVFGLLIQSHYQTTPDDLMRILDAEDYFIFVLANTKQLSDLECCVEAVAVVVEEGGWEQDIDKIVIEGVLSAERRVKGHLVPQNLATALCDEWFIHAKSWRINRIAVLPEIRLLGRGKKLLQHIKLVAQQNELEYLSTSFGLTSDLYNFWHSQAYSLNKIGARRDTSSGEHSGIMICPLTHKALEKFSACTEIFSNDMSYLLDYVIQENAKDDSAVFIRELIKQHIIVSKSSLDNEAQSASINGHLQQIKTRTNTYYCKESSPRSITEKAHLLRVEQFLNGIRSFTNAAASIYFYTRHDSENELLRIFNSAHQKHRSKEHKLATMKDLRSKLKQLLQV
ncbi:MAG: tRNA(Met) cytidine acetyltransferase [Glaciecola sp.]